MTPKTPQQEAVEHIRFQLELLRLCAVPALSKSVKPELVGTVPELPQAQMLEELVLTGRS